MVEPDPRVLGREGVDEGLPGVDRAHRLIGRGDPGVEVQGVAHRAIVDQGDLEGVPHLAAQDGAGNLPVEGQAPLGDTGADRHDLLLDGEGVPVGHGTAVGTGRGRWQGGVEGLEACGQLGRIVGNRVLAGAGLIALATAVLVIAVLVAGGGRPARGDVEDHALGAVAGDGAPALDRTRDDAGVEGALGSGGDAPGGLAGCQDEVVDLVGGVVQGDDEPVAGGDVDRVRHEPQALHRDGGVDGVAGGRDVLGGSALTPVADDTADDDGRSGGEQPHEDAAAVGGLEQAAQGRCGGPVSRRRAGPAGQGAAVAVDGRGGTGRHRSTVGALGLTGARRRAPSSVAGGLSRTVGAAALGLLEGSVLRRGVLGASSLRSGGLIRGWCLCVGRLRHRVPLRGWADRWPAGSEVGSASAGVRGVRGGRLRWETSRRLSIMPASR